MSVADFLAELRPRVAGELRDDLYSRTLYSTDASLYQVMPYGVLIPRHADDMQAAVELAAKHHVPLLPRAAGSSLAGQSVNQALVMDTSRYLDQVLEINAEERWVRVQPGVVLDKLNGDLRPYGLQFGPDPASANRACLGGIVSNNATGSHSILYGMTADHVQEMQVILADGTYARLQPLEPAQVAWQAQQANRLGGITAGVAALVGDERSRAAIRAGTPRHWRRCGGYNLARFVHDGSIDHYLPQDPRFNLAQLVCGAEGTLAAITELKLKLVPRPKLTALVIIEFPTLLSSLEATPAILETQPSAVELIDDLSLRMARVNPAVRPPAAHLSARRRLLFPGRRILRRERGRTGGQVREADRPPARPGRSDRPDHPAAGQGPPGQRVGAAQGGAWLIDERAQRLEADPVYRGYRGAARAPGFLYPPDRCLLPRPGNRDDLLRPCQFGLPAHPAADQHQACALRSTR